MTPDAPTGGEHTIAIVVPVYRGEQILRPLVEEIAPLVEQQTTPGGARFRVVEMILVHDAGPDASDVVIRELARHHPFVRPVWLARNYGQHAATLAGMSSTSADWIVTMDEDGQHDPLAIAAMLDVALSTRSPLVYARPTNAPPHGVLRNAASRTAHGAARLLGAGALDHFHSFRLVLGEVAVVSLPIAVRACTSTWRSPGSFTAPSRARSRCGRNGGVLPATRPGSSRRTSGGWC
jgi:polyisoprenyl-phosphate glycosyltransferase